MPPWLQQRHEQGFLDCFRGVAWWPPLPDERRESRWGFRFSFITWKSPLFPWHILYPFVYVYACNWIFFLWFVPFFADKVFCFPNGFADKHAAVPNFNLINQQSLDKILKAEVFIHSDGQLKAAHLILGCTPFSSSFQALKCVIKAKNPRLHLINVAILGFLNLGSGPQGVLKVEPILQFEVEDKATPS